MKSICRVSVCGLLCIITADSMSANLAETLFFARLIAVSYIRSAKEKIKKLVTSDKYEKDQEQSDEI